MGNRLSIAQLYIEDFLRVNNAAGVLRAFQFPLISLFGSSAARIKSLVEIATYYPRTSIGALAIAKANEMTKRYLPCLRQVEKAEVSRSAIVKPFISEKEPGFLLVSFEQNLEAIVKLRSFPKLSRQYRILFLPTWQPFYSTAVCLLAARSQEPFFIMPSAFSEEDLCRKFSPLCRFLPFHAASWVRGDLYDAPCGNRPIDILMVANFSKFKRHWRLFEGLSNFPGNLTVTLAGTPWDGRTRESLIKEASLFGVQSQITIIEGASDHPSLRVKGKPTIQALLRKSKLFCAMSAKEGSYIAVAEALMAGTPVAMFRSAKIGTRAYINPETGFLLSDDRPLGPQLYEILERCRSMNPQPWAKRHISAAVNCRKLNDLLRRWSEDHDLIWKNDIEPFFSRHFEFEYMDSGAEERLRQEYERVKDHFGLTIKRI